MEEHLSQLNQVAGVDVILDLDVAVLGIALGVLEGLDYQEEDWSDELNAQQVVELEAMAELSGVLIAGRVLDEDEEVDDAFSCEIPEQVHQQEEHHIGEQVRQRDKADFVPRVSVKDAQQQHPAAEKDGSAPHQQHPDHHEAHQVFQRSEHPELSVVFVDFIGDEVAHAGPAVGVEEDFRSDGLLILIDILVLEQLPQGHVDPEGDPDQQQLCDVCAQVHEGLEGLLQDEQQQVGHSGRDEVVQHVHFKRNLVPHHVSEVVSHCAQVCKQHMDGPLLSNIVPIHSPSHAVLLLFVGSCPRLLELRPKCEHVEPYLLQEVQLESFFEHKVGYLYFLHLQKEVDLALGANHLRLVEQHASESLEKARAFVELGGENKLLENGGLLSGVEVVFLGEEFDDVEVLGPLGVLLVDGLAAVIDLLLVVQKDVLLLAVGKDQAFVLLKVLEGGVQLLVVQQKPVLLLKSKALLIYDLVDLQKPVSNTEVAVGLLVVSDHCCVVLVGRVQLQGPPIVPTRVIQSEVYLRILDLLFHFVFCSHLEPVFRAEVQKQENALVFDVFIIEEEGAYPEATNLLEGVNDGVVLEGEGVQDFFPFVDAFNLERLREVRLVQEMQGLASAEALLQGFLQPDLYGLAAHVLVLLGHLGQDGLLGLAEGTFQLVGGTAQVRGQGQELAALDVVVFGNSHGKHQVRL